MLFQGARSHTLTLKAFKEREVSTWICSDLDSLLFACCPYRPKRDSVSEHGDDVTQMLPFSEGSVHRYSDTHPHPPAQSEAHRSVGKREPRKARVIHEYLHHSTSIMAHYAECV